MAGAEYQFVAWTRSGIGAMLGGSSQTATIDLGTAGQATATLATYALADVSGIAASAVLRTVPADGVQDFEPSLFPAVELAHPALPWMLGGPADVSGKIAPWICLVVVQDQPGVTLTSSTLSIAAPAVPANELPLLSQAWAWAHAQTIATEGAALDTASLGTSGGAGRARLVAPRKLAAATSYIAAVVPTTPAWTGSETSIALTVYYAWRFATGADGDFASLARRLQPGPLDASVGHRTIDISSPGWGAPSASGATLDVSSALHSPAWMPPATATAAATAIGTAIANELVAQASPPASQAPVLAPPSYGAAITKQDVLSAAPAWQSALNQDVAQRIAAGVGADLIRSDVDTYADAAWRSTGDTELINHAIRGAELAGTIAQALGDKHLGALASDGELLAVARPLATRMRLDTTATGPSSTLAAAIVASSMPQTALSASLRRLGRNGGLITRSVATKTGDMIASVNARQITGDPPKVLATGAAGFDAVSVAAATTVRIALATPALVESSAAHWTATLTATTTKVGATTTVAVDKMAVEKPAADLATTTPVVAKAPPLVAVTHIPVGEEGTIPPLLSKGVTEVAPIDEFRAAAAAQQQYITTHLEPISDTRSPLGTITATEPLAVVRAAIAAQWTPAHGIMPILAARVTGVTVSTFSPIAATPVLQQPLIQTLAAHSPELVMPGLDSLLSNRAALAITDQDFVRALIVGANEQLARELLWRQYPGALGHTWLQTFWGRVAVASDGSVQAVPDVPAIETWPAAGPPPIPDMLVLAVRADVLQRYPNALVYALPAAWQGSNRVVGTGAEVPPVVATTLGPDVALFGFDLTADAARGGSVNTGPAGYYFVIAEHPHEPRFGLAASPTTNPTSWADVAWSDTVAADLAGSYLRTDGPLAQRTASSTPALRWGVDGGAQAAIGLRPTVRVAIHASTLM